MAEAAHGERSETLHGMVVRNTGSWYEVRTDAAAYWSAR